MAGILDDFERDIQSISEWAESKPIILDGKSFSFKNHEYLKEPYEDTHPYMVEMKAAQLGLTCKAMLKSLYNCKHRGLNVLYLFPSQTDVLDFSKSRITPLIADNPDSIGRWIADTDAAGLKRIGKNFLYLRGMRSRVGLKSIPVDHVVFDELDEGDPAAISMAVERMAHSEQKETTMLSNPTLPDYGIDAEFQLTDQRYWLLKCDKCGEYTCLEDTFPDCLVELDDRVIRACRKCHAELNPSIGEWVAKRPSITDRRGYHYSQLFSHYVDPADILHKFRTTNNLTNFYNLVIGNAYVEAVNRLSVQEILALCGNYGIENYNSVPCTMGVDQGKGLHVVIGDTSYNRRIVHLGEYSEWEELDRLMDSFNVTRCVVDALPETRNARALAKRFPGKVYLNYYNEHQKGSYAWNERDFIVSCNRTESLDASHREIQDRNIILPRESGIVQEFAQHLHNVAKRLEENEETGSKRYVYVKLGVDHYRHAFNYEVIANSSVSRGFFSGCDLS